MLSACLARLYFPSLRERFVQIYSSSVVERATLCANCFRVTYDSVLCWQVTLLFWICLSFLITLYFVFRFTYYICVCSVKLGVGGFSMGAASALYSSMCHVLGQYGNGNPYTLNLSVIVGLSGWLPCSRFGCSFLLMYLISM